MQLFQPSKIAIVLCLSSALLQAQKSAESVFKEAEALSAKEDNRAALPLLLEARRLFKSEEKPAREADVLDELGATYFVLGDLDHALISYQEMLSVARTIDDRKHEAAAIRKVGDVH